MANKNPGNSGSRMNNPAFGGGAASYQGHDNYTFVNENDSVLQHGPAAYEKPSNETISEVFL